MPIHREDDIAISLQHLDLFLPVERRIRARNPVNEQEMSVDELRAAVESLQQIVCHLLLRNQVLRMALDGNRRILTTSSSAGFPIGQSQDSE
jgi:hypothetical protein